MVNDTGAGPALFPSHQRPGDTGTVKSKQNPSLGVLIPCDLRTDITLKPVGFGG